MFDWTTKEKDWTKFLLELGYFLENYDMISELAFDIYDCNKDHEVSELDMMKFLKIFEEGPMSEHFDKILFKDLCQITRRLHIHKDLKYEQDVDKNEGNELFLERYLNFRNLIRRDKNYLNLKEKIMWPLFEFKSQIKAPVQK